MEPEFTVSPNSQLSVVGEKSRAPEFYGFVAWSSTYLLFVLYILWALLPDDIIVRCGITWYPNREWALLLPAYGMFLVLLTYFVYFAMAIFATPSLDHPSTMTDSHMHVVKREESGKDGIEGCGIDDSGDPFQRAAQTDAIPELYDIPIGLVNQVLYGRNIESDGSGDDDYDDKLRDVDDTLQQD